MSVCIHFLLLVMIGHYQTEAACGVGWFGDRCQFQCHCFDNSPCDVTGQCANNKCASGWFGFKCQYQDVINTIQVLNVTNQIDTSQWRDGNDFTCFMHDAIKSVLITLRKKAIFLWLRVTVSDKALFDTFKIHFEDVNVVNKRYDCQGMKLTLMDERTADIRCEMNMPVDKVVLEGDGISSLCSLYICGGRNVALKQTAEQTSTADGNYSASNAVDGNTNTRFNYGTCTLTNNMSEPLQNWTLTFEELVVVNSFDIYDRFDIVSYLLNSRMLTFSENDTILFNVLYPFGYIYMLFNTFVHPSATPVKRLSIMASARLLPTSIISFCEINVYGECPPGKWGLDCKQACDTKCSDFCREFDGACPTHCLGFSDPPACTKDCPADKWGLNCRQDCSDRCQYQYCDSIDGLCTAGCDGYSDPPYCTQACAKGFYGVNCKQEIPGGCTNTNCALRNKTCPNSCDVTDDEGCVDPTESSSFHAASFGIGVGTTLAVLILLAVAVGVIVRHFRNHPRPTDTGNKIPENNAAGPVRCLGHYDEPIPEALYVGLYENPAVVNTRKQAS